MASQTWWLCSPAVFNKMLLFLCKWGHLHHQESITLLLQGDAHTCWRILTRDGQPHPWPKPFANQIAVKTSPEMEAAEKAMPDTPLRISPAANRNAGLNRSNSTAVVNSLMAYARLWLLRIMPAWWRLLLLVNRARWWTWKRHWKLFNFLLLTATYFFFFKELRNKLTPPT